MAQTLHLQSSIQWPILERINACPGSIRLSTTSAPIANDMSLMTVEPTEDDSFQSGDRNVKADLKQDSHRAGAEGETNEGQERNIYKLGLQESLRGTNLSSEHSVLSSRNHSVTMTDGPVSLPIVDISAFLDPFASSEARRNTAHAVERACVEFGFFYLTGHGIPTTKLDQIISLARQFFASPLSQKKKIKRYDAGGPEGGDGARGYQGMGENITLGKRDHQEAVDLYREWDHDTKRAESVGPNTHQTLQGPNLWPHEPAELKDVYLDYIEQLQQVGKALVRAMGVALNLGAPSPDANSETEDDEVFVRNTDHSFWVMRMIGYPKLETPFEEGTDPSDFSCGEHSDYGCVTLLLADPTPGALQVLLKDGKTWLNADPVAGAFVVNIGDMIERWTNGLWKSTRHRVIHRGDGYRVSVPFFYEPNFDAVVKPLQKCVERTGGVPVHKGNTYGEHLLGKVFNNFYSEVIGETNVETTL